LFEKDPKYKKLIKYSILLSIKESYLLARNFWGMGQHPFKTVRALIRERDYSQIFLVLAFPAYVLLGGFFLIWFARRLFGVTPWDWGLKTKGGISLVVLISLTSFLYLFFWFYKVWKVRK
jgi:hypothetical protein